MRVLVADDDPLSLHMVVYRLRQWGHEVVTCGDGHEAWNIFQSDGVPNIAILDWMMPGIDGIQLCKNVRAITHAPYVYIILLTGKDHPQDLIAGLDAGADDYLTKPFHLGELEARLRAGKRIVDLQAELISAREALRIQAMQDPLTQSLNHGAIVDCLLRELARADREDNPLSIILADLDDFKRINDSFGHLAGDHVLVEVAQRIRKCIRPYDSIGRYGGEEFLIVLPGSDEHTAIMQAERIRTSLFEKPFVVNGIPLTVTASQGVTTWTITHPLNVKALINTADGALYLVKNSGRNKVEFASYDKENSGDDLKIPVKRFSKQS